MNCILITVCSEAAWSKVSRALVFVTQKPNGSCTSHCNMNPICAIARRCLSRVHTARTTAYDASIRKHMKIFPLKVAESPLVILHQKINGLRLTIIIVCKQLWSICSAPQPFRKLLITILHKYFALIYFYTTSQICTSSSIKLDT